jgi:hypothetical protein
MTTKNGLQNLFLGNTHIIGPIQAPTSATAAGFRFSFGDATNTTTWTLSLGRLRYTNDGAFDPTVGVSTSSGNLVCMQNSL